MQIGAILRGKIVHLKQSAYTELLRLMVCDTSNRMSTYWLDQTFSKWRKTIRTLKLLTALFFIIPTLRNGNM